MESGGWAAPLPIPDSPFPIMEDILAVIMIFGGGTLAALAFSPIGRAIGQRIRGDTGVPPSSADPAVYEELERLRQEIAELAERLDFAERLLAQRKEPEKIAGS